MYCHHNMIITIKHIINGYSDMREPKISKNLTVLCSSKTDLRYGMNKLYPTEVFLGRAEDNNKHHYDKFLNEVIKNFDLDIITTDFGTDLLNSDNEIFKTFRDEVVFPDFKNYCKSLNITVKRDMAFLRSRLVGCKSGYYIPLHTHAASHFSSVYYLISEGEIEGGELIIEDPRTHAKRGYWNDDVEEMFYRQVFAPTSYDHIIFPSFLEHHSVPFKGNLRLALSVDLYILPESDILQPFLDPF